MVAETLSIGHSAHIGQTSGQYYWYAICFGIFGLVTEPNSQPVLLSQTWQKSLRGNDASIWFTNMPYRNTQSTLCIFHCAEISTETVNRNYPNTRRFGLSIEISLPLQFLSIKQFILIVHVLIDRPGSYDLLVSNVSHQMNKK